MKTSALPASEQTTTNVLGVEVACVDRTRLFSHVTGWVRGPSSGAAAAGESGAPRLVTYVNAHGLNLAGRDPAYRALLNHAADLVYTDGIGVVWAARFLSGERLTKLTGADWIGDFCRLAQQNGWRLYLLAGRPGIARRAEQNLRSEFPGLQITGASDGFFIERTEEEVLEELARIQPDILFVGMGAPRQETWVAAHRQKLPVKVCWAVGALFDYIAGSEGRVPAQMNALGLEWFWRLLQDPLGKWRRYLLGNPWFVYRVLLQKWDRAHLDEPG